MIYITQLIFIQPGKEHTFHEFESFAIPLMEKYSGRMLYRIRPDEKSYISFVDEKPYEVHFLSFDSENDLKQFLNDKSRQDYIHLKQESIRSTIIVKGEKL